MLKQYHNNTAWRDVSKAPEVLNHGESNLRPHTWIRAQKLCQRGRQTLIYVGVLYT